MAGGFAFHSINSILERQRNIHRHKFSRVEKVTEGLKEGEKINTIYQRNVDRIDDNYYDLYEDKYLLMNDIVSVEDITGDEKTMEIPRNHDGSGRVGLDKLMITITIPQNPNCDDVYDHCTTPKTTTTSSSTNVSANRKRRYTNESDLTEESRFLFWDKSQFEQFQCIYAYIGHKKEGMNT